MFDFKGKTVLVTGGSRGIGHAISRFFIEAGAHVIVNFLPQNKRDIEGYKQLEETLHKTHGSYMAMPCDITDPEQVQEMCTTASEKTGSIDILVNSAGFATPIKFMDITPDLWKTGVDVNLSGAFYITHATAKYMLRKKWGRIIYIGSSGSITGGGGSAFYSASKAGINGLVRKLSKELAPEGITVNAILPAIIETDMLRDREPDPKKRKEYIKRVPVGRLGQPEDVAYLALFLASDYASYITSQQIIVDGGSTFN